MTFTEEQILSLAPDDSSKKSGKELANLSKWIKFEQSENAIWGECKGSGKLPYQTQVDLKNIAFKCTCPSRKFPCKHGLGLSLLFSRDSKSFQITTEPDWVSNWLEKRNEREEKKEEKKVKQEIDPVAQAKRQENRFKRIEDGSEDLKRWIKDIVRNGLLTLPAKEPGYFETMARRMVDAQAPGLAGMVRSLGEINFYREGWQTPFLDQISRIFLVLHGLSRMDELPTDMQEEIKTQIGFLQNQETLKAEDGLRDHWFVLAKNIEKEDNLTIEQNWLYGCQSNRFALFLQFYVRSQLPEINLMPGTFIDAAVVYYKGSNSIRALIKDHHVIQKNDVLTGIPSFHAVAEVISKQISVNPFLSQFPVIIDDVYLVQRGDQWLLKDSLGNGVAISPKFKSIWNMLALSGGKKLKVFAIGKENEYEPIGVWIDNHYKVLQ
jgi:hypothetical protein